MSRREYVLVMLLFLLVIYPTVQIMTRIKGRAWMFMWRNELFHRRGPLWRT